MEIVSSYGERIHKVVSEPDKGIYDAMNKGVSLASGEIVGILNSDDFYTSETVLEQLVATFDTDTKGVYGDLVYVDQENTDLIKRKWIAGEYIPGSFTKGWMPPHPTFFVRKEVYEKFGAYSMQLKSAADYEFMLRVIHKHEIPIKYLPQILTKMRVGGKSNMSIANRLKANKEDRKAWEMNGLKVSKLTLIRKPLSKIGQFIKK